MSDTRIWLTPSRPDAEAEAIRELLAECGETIAETWDDPRVEAIRRGGGSIVAVEREDIPHWTGHWDPQACDCAALLEICDHHAPGDPGYGRPPEQFLPASSLGQVIVRLARLERLPAHWHREPEQPHERLQPLDFVDSLVEALTPSPERTYVLRSVGGWFVRCPRTQQLAEVPPHYVYVAAADHCLGAAYAGRCPAVDPDWLYAQRVEQKAAFRRTTTEAVRADILAARAALRAASDLVLAHHYCEWHTTHRRDIGDCVNAAGTDWAEQPCSAIAARDMRGRHVPELPEAAALEGICFVADGLPGPDGRVKVVCQSGSPEQIEAFMRVWAPAQGLTDVYGDPARGFAGAYVQGR